MISATVAVCTRNRVEFLEQCLASLENQLRSATDGLEVLVVDNGSTDGTSRLLREWQAGRSDRRAVVEPRLGIAHARNTSLREATGEVVLSVDDDALVATNWARGHLDVFTADATVGVVGGPIGLHWPAGRPPWMTDELTQWLSSLDLGDERVEFPTVHGPYGTNMAVRRDAAMEVGGFDPWLGRRGGVLLSGEEPDLTRRMRAAGWRVVYEPSAAVVHQVLPDRLNRSWLKRRSRAQGRTNARLDILASRPSRVECLARTRSELGDTTQRLWRRVTRRSGEEELAELCRILCHSASSREYARRAFHPMHTLGHRRDSMTASASAAARPQS